MHSVQKSLCVRVCTNVCICSRSSKLSFFSLAKYPRSFIVFLAAIEYKEGPVRWQAGRLAGSVVRRWAPRPGGRSRALRQLSYTKLARAGSWSCCHACQSWTEMEYVNWIGVSKLLEDTAYQEKLQMCIWSLWWRTSCENRFPLFFHTFLSFQQVEPSSDFYFVFSMMTLFVCLFYVGFLKVIGFSGCKW